MNGLAKPLGLRKGTTRHGADVRARATAALLVGERPAVVARNLGVPEGTVRSWKYRLKNGGVATLKKGNFGGLLMEHLRAMLRSLIEQSRMMQDPGLLKGIPPGELAVLFGTLFDRTMRMLEVSRALIGPEMLTNVYPETEYSGAKKGEKTNG